MAKVIDPDPQLSTGLTYAGTMQCISHKGNQKTVRMYRKRKPKDVSFQRCAAGVKSAAEKAWREGGSPLWEAYQELANLFSWIAFELFMTETSDGCLNDEYDNNEYGKLRYG